MRPAASRLDADPAPSGKGPAQLSDEALRLAALVTIDVGGLAMPSPVSITMRIAAAFNAFANGR